MKETNTLGGRIQEGRKAAGLSQETLGEKLEVSRQAVSKWESDAAIPELEKLIAMSRLFGVTVGELLGVERPAEAAGELTERELAAAAAIAERMAGTRRPWSRRRRLLTACAGALTGLLLLALTAGTIFLGAGMRAMQSRMDVLEGRVSGLGNGVVQYVPQPEPDGLLLTYDLVPMEVDVETKTVVFRVSATPREQAEGASAVFTAQLSDGRRLSCEALFDQGAFTAQDWAIPLDDRIEVSITLTEGETSRTGLLETLYGYGPESTGLEVYGSWDASYRSNGGYIDLKNLWLRIMAGGDMSVRLHVVPVQIDLCVYRNGETDPEQVFPMEGLTEDFAENGMLELSDWTGYETRVELEPGDIAVAAVRVEDSLGRVLYAPTGAWTRGDGGLDSLTLPEGWTPGASLT